MVSAQLLHDRYFNESNCIISIKLKSGRTIQGTIAGYYADGDAIIKWHITERTKKSILHIDAFGYLEGEIINHDDILEVHSMEEPNNNK